MYFPANLPTSHCAPGLGIAGWEGLALAYHETSSLKLDGICLPRMTEEYVMVGKKTSLVIKT